jgi:O-antigen ligase
MADWIDLVVLVGLLFLTQALSARFSQLGFDSVSIHVTEVAMLAALGFALWRHGLRGAFDTVADRVPLPLLVVLWLAGAIAVLRGLSAFGLDRTIDDIGLVDYTLVLVLVALVVDSRPRLEAVTLALAGGGLATLLLFGIPDIGARTFSDTSTTIGFPPAAVGLSVSFYIVWVAARVVSDAPPSVPHLILAAAGLVVVGLAQARGAWIALAAGLLAVAVLSDTWRRRAVATAAALGLSAASVFGALAVETALGDRVVPPGAERADVRTVEGEAEAWTGDENSRWRFAFWGELLERSTDRPVLGAGFAEPSRFVWEGELYDARTGEPGFDVTGPHNGFVDIVYRMGVPALAAVVGLMAVALWRLRTSLDGRQRGDPDRLRQVTLLGMFAAAVAIVSFNDALRVPYLAIFFWALLGLLLVEGRIGRSERR